MEQGDFLALCFYTVGSKYHIKIWDPKPPTTFLFYFTLQKKVVTFTVRANSFKF